MSESQLVVVWRRCCVGCMVVDVGGGGGIRNTSNCTYKHCRRNCVVSDKVGKFRTDRPLIAKMQSPACSGVVAPRKKRLDDGVVVVVVVVAAPL